MNTRFFMRLISQYSTLVENAWEEGWEVKLAEYLADAVENIETCKQKVAKNKAERKAVQITYDQAIAALDDQLLDIQDGECEHRLINPVNDGREGLYCQICDARITPEPSEANAAPAVSE